MRPWAVPEAVEVALRAASSAVVGDVAGPALTRAIVDRSRRYTTDRAHLADEPAGDLAARAMFFTVADCAKVRIPLAELAHADALPTATPLRVVDLGAGCGAMTIGLALHLPDRAIEAVLIDHDADALAIATHALGAIAPSIAVRAVEADVATATIPRCDLVLLGTVLNELPPDVALTVVQRSLAALRDHGAVIIVEPALQDTARALHALRDAAIAAGSHSFAPCPHDAPCPLPARDWCHEERPVVLPPRTRQLATATGLRDAAMKFSYQVLRREPGTVAPGALRVVGNPHAQKGKHEVPTCSAAGYTTIRLLHRHKSAANRALLRAELGDLLQLDPPATDITAETSVTVLRPADGQ